MTLRSDLIDRTDIRQFVAHRPQLLPLPEAASPWWLGALPSDMRERTVEPGALVLVAVQGQQQCRKCGLQVPVYHWCKVISLVAVRAVVVTLGGGPRAHGVLPGELLEIEPARHVLMTLAGLDELVAFEEWAQGRRANWAGMLYSESPRESNWAAEAAGANA